VSILNSTDASAAALANIRDAIEGYLASLEKHGEPVPPPISEEIIEVSAK
jgi:antitoxin HicB